jgi:hypothetical protein
MVLDPRDVPSVEPRAVYPRARGKTSKMYRCANQDEDPAHAIHYDCATRAANLRFDGDQRPMTKLEQVTLFK